MNSITVNAKALWQRDNIIAKTSLGAKHIEIQLLFELFGEYDFDMSILDICDVTAIHTPLYNKTETSVGYVTWKDLLRKTCRLAEKVAKIERHPVTVIVHNTISIHYQEKIGILDDNIAFLKEMVNRYPNVIVAIENSAVFYAEKNNIRFRSNMVDDSVDLAKACSHERIGTVLDICHALMNEKLMNSLKTGYSEQYTVDCSLEHHFVANADTVKLIHMCNIHDNGFGTDHGIPFYRNNEVDMSKLKEIFDLYIKYGNRCPLTLEVREDDYLNCVNYKETFEAFKEVNNNHFVLA